MGRKSSITKLPKEVRQQLDRLIGEDKLTLDALRTFLLSHEGVDGEEVPSRTAIWRHAISIKEAAKNLQESRDITAGIVQELGVEGVESQQGRLLVEMLRDYVFREINRRRDADEPIDMKEVSQFARALKDLSHSMRLEQDFTTKIKEEATRETKEAAVRTVQEVGRERGLSAELVADIQEKILGVRLPGPSSGEAA